MSLTPYDTGDRLEPKLWINPVSRDNSRTPADYGKVDFDNDAEQTMLTLYVEANDEGGYTLHVDNAAGLDLKVEVM